jgi:hypothetical protein
MTPTLRFRAIHGRDYTSPCSFPHLVSQEKQTYTKLSSEQKKQFYNPKDKSESTILKDLYLDGRKKNPGDLP